VSEELLSPTGVGMTRLASANFYIEILSLFKAFVNSIWLTLGQTRAALAESAAHKAI
jgi:hypothetical protein